MAEKKKGKKRKEDFRPTGEEQADKPSKEEFAIAKWMRGNVPIKKTKFLNHNVEYFTAKRAVDALLESKWSQGNEALFKTRDDIVDYLHVMLLHKFYHRAKKVPVSEQELKGKKKDKKGDTAEPVKEKERGTDAESSVVEGKDIKDGTVVEKEKKKKKIRLEMHKEQFFVDGLDAYVWIYDPIPFHYWIFGTLVVLGAIGVCLFPLWPPSVRLGVYYLSVAAAVFLVSIIVLAVLRLIIFCAIWGLTFGKHHLWILPNLTEDVGFLASFWPLYNYEYKGGSSEDKSKDKTKKKKKDKDSDVEQEDDVIKNDDVKMIENVQTDILDDKANKIETLGASETESESSQRSSTGKDFEIVDQDELES